MKILLADDDKLIRFSLKSILAEIPDFEFIITEASNGLEMIQRCNEFDPDIAFVDIRMPHLNGIEAIEACQKNSPETEFVIISGYSDFEYAKKCITLGVTDYILKPVEADYLKTIISRLREKLSHRMTQKNNQFQLYIHDYFLSPFKEISPALSEDFCPETGECFLAYTIFVDCINEPKVYHEICNNLIAKIKTYGSDIVKRNMYYSVLYSLEGSLRIIFKVPLTSSGYVRNKLEQLCKSIASESKRLYLFYTIQADIGAVYEALENIEEFQYLRMGLRPCESLLIDSLDFEHMKTDFYKNLYSLITAFLEANENTYTHSLNVLYRTYCHQQVDFPLENLSAYIRCVLGKEVSTKNFKEFMKSFTEFSDSMYENLEYKVTDKIDLIINYIQHTYMNDISINQIAAKFNLTPNYVSKLFHDKTNTKFIDYLTNVRINHAKRLLISNSDTPVKEIALMVGYYSSRHFSSTFKKYTNVYPTEYRKKHCGEGKDW